MSIPLKVKNIGASKYKSRDFALTIIYILDIDKQGYKIYASISCKLHLINRLKVNMLVGNDMLCTKGFAINLFTSSILIHSCSIKISINAK